MLIDMHHHLIYGLDDGAQTFEETQKMLRAAHQQGVTHIITTPHGTPGREPFRLMEYLDRIEETKAWIRQEGLDIRIYPGCEIFYTEDTVRMLNEARIPTLAGTHYVLCEFGVEAPYEYLAGAARKLGVAGYHVIFAHVERYRCLRKFRNLLELHEDYEVLMQVNARTFLEPDGFMTRHWLRKAMDRELIDLAASDAHGVRSRNCRLGDCRKLLSHEYGRDTADLLCEDIPRRILGKKNKI